MLLLGRLKDEIERCLVPQVLDDLLGLVGVPDVIRELFEILLKALVLLLVVRQSLQALLLCPFVFVHLILT